MTSGLVLGKFAPLHKGHQLLIETALQENEHVIVMIYHSPEVTTIPLPVRAGWIKQLYPQIEIIEAWDGPMEVGDTPDIRLRHEQYLLKKLGTQAITNFYSSEFYGQHVSEALGANDRRVDSKRTQIPVSATVIRDNPFQNRKYLAPVVYQDLITKVVFLGAPSTGKTTLARELANIHETVWMPEYGREYWEKHHSERRLTMEQMVEIAEVHRQRENAFIHQANRFLFVDTDATTTSMFSMAHHNQVHPRLAELASETKNRYDLFFLCGAEIPYDDTWDRSGDADRQVFQEQIKSDLLLRHLPFITLIGTLEERLNIVNNILQNFDKYRPLGDQLLNWLPLN